MTSPTWGVPRGPAAPLVLVALTSAAAGLVLARLGAVAGPAAVAAVPVALAVAVWALHRPLVAAALLPLSLPVGLVALPGGVIQVIQVVQVAVVGLVAAARLARGAGALPWLPHTGWLFALLLLLVVATPGAPDPTVALQQVAAAVAGALLALALAGACRGLHDLRLLVGLLLGAGLYICATSLPQATQVSATGGAAIVSGATGGFSEHNQFGALAAVLLLLAVGALLGARGPWSRLGAGLTVVVALVSVALALSRGAYLGTLLGGIALLVALPQARRALLTAGIPLVLAGGLLAAFVPDSPQVTIVRDRVASISSPESNPYDDRPAIWKEGRRQVRLDPLTGVGPGNFPVVARRSTSDASFAQPEHAHDVLLTVAAEAGLPAAGLVVALTLLYARTMLRVVRAVGDPRDKALVAGIAAALATFVGQGLFDNTLRSPVVLALLFLCLGLGLAAQHVLREPDGGVRPGRAPA